MKIVLCFAWLSLSFLALLFTALFIPDETMTGQWIVLDVMKTFFVTVVVVLPPMMAFMYLSLSEIRHSRIDLCAVLANIFGER